MEKANLVEPEPALNELAGRVIGAAIEVHRVLGPGFLEAVYHQAMMVELRLRDLSFASEVKVAVDYKGHSVGEGRLDLVVAEQLIVELKAVDALAPIHTAQRISYLKLTGRHLGLLINFNVPVLRDGLKRVVRS